MEDIALEELRVPVLLVHHLYDGCPVSNYDVVGEMKVRLDHVPEVEVLSYSGGEERDSNPCRAQTYHGFLGIEQQVVDDIAAWIKKPR